MSSSGYPSPLVDFFAGLISGMVGLLVGYPFDTVKVRFQTPELTGRYHSSFKAFVTILKEEGWVGLYKGIASPLASGPFMNGLIFAAYGAFTDLQLDSPRDTASLAQIAIAGFGVGLVLSVLTTPVELIKIQQQAMKASGMPAHKIPSAWRIAALILEQHGLHGLYRGLVATIVRDGPGYAVFFVTYEGTNRAFARPLHATPAADYDPGIGDPARAVPWPAHFAAGALAGAAGWLATYPADVAKTRMQGSGLLDDAPHPYADARATAQATYAEGGVRAFFSGVVPCVVRAVPVNAVNFGVYQAVVALFG